MDEVEFMEQHYERIVKDFKKSTGLDPDINELEFGDYVWNEYNDYLSYLADMREDELRWTR